QDFPQFVITAEGFFPLSSDFFHRAYQDLGLSPVPPVNPKDIALHKPPFSFSLFSYGGKVLA
ncbi:MAG: hypothetical protein Q7S46_03355, partial [Gallionella sp.]|nr:hypothetical protein [Gallionella sp.]